jgi:murein DD-endopeptidase MepM/ murein hydrolase activator NlpD
VLALAAGSRRFVCTVVGVSLASVLSAGLLVSVASADPLTDHRDAVNSQIAKTKRDLNESSAQLQNAAVRVDRTQGQLDAANAALEETRRQLAAAQDRDRMMAAKLAKARKELAAAKAAVVAGQKALDTERAMAGDVVRDQYQQQTNLLPIALLVSDSTADLGTRLQWSTTLFDTTQAQIDRLTEAQQKLTAERAHQAQLEAEVAQQRAAAAANLKVTEGLERQAAAQQAAVAGLLAQRQAEESAAAKDVATDKRRYADLNKERAAVEHRIAVRIARAKAAAARRAAAERAAKAAARRAAAADRAAKAAKRRQHAHQHSSSGSSSGGSRSGGSGSGGSGSGGSSSGGSSSGGSSSGWSSASHGFSYPVSAPITSPYGMRFHPVLHYWKLHDGTDFGAGCGTAIRAPYPGRVAERYYNVGYGNRLMIDHGYVDGRYVTTGYNHAIRYVVSVGQHVSKGQVIGYVGTTGFSTGCHLHLMVWINDGVVNPMT